MISVCIIKTQTVYVYENVNNGYIVNAYNVSNHIPDINFY